MTTNFGSQTGALSSSLRIAPSVTVYHGILMMQSPIFRDLLSLPQPNDAETFEGRPVVYLEDSAADVQELMRFLFDRR